MSAHGQKSARYAIQTLVATLLVLCLPLQSQAERYAFVVGNADYVHAGTLDNAVRDAEDIAKVLSDLGYVVTNNIDVSRTDFLKQFQDFTQQLSEDDLALVYYAGHGLQLGGENYIVPIDAKLVSEAHAKQNLVSLNALLTDLSRATRNRILILDACRNNPFIEEINRSRTTRGDRPQGLARVFAGVGSYIAFSTQPGNVALDGMGKNSPFAAALLKHIGNQELDVHGVMRRVRADVQTSTDSQQIPWESSSLVEDVRFSYTEEHPTPTPANPDHSDVKYSYVDGLDPNGDNFLALREGYWKGAKRLATMESGTLLTVMESNGVWKRVKLNDGSEGWAHGNWIECCTTLSQSVSDVPVVSDAADQTQSCDALWRERNAIWHKYNYCFNSDKAIAEFGNENCFMNQKEASAAMSVADARDVRRVLEQEVRLGCR